MAQIQILVVLTQDIPTICKAGDIGILSQEIINDQYPYTIYLKQDNTCNCFSSNEFELLSIL